LEVLNPAEDDMTNDLRGPVAILDKEIAKYPTYTIETFELCDCCGMRFGIGYHQGCKHPSRAAGLENNLPEKLREMLASDHGHDRKHKHFAEIWVVSDWSAAS
jgi:hypothetical protein